MTTTMTMTGGAAITMMGGVTITMTGGVTTMMTGGVTGVKEEIAPRAPTSQARCQSHKSPCLPPCGCLVRDWPAYSVWRRGESGKRHKHIHGETGGATSKKH